MHGPDDYKTGKKYGERPAMVIPSFIYPELEAFIDTWRQEMKPSHPRLFSRPASGEPDRWAVVGSVGSATMVAWWCVPVPQQIHDFRLLQQS